MAVRSLTFSADSKELITASDDMHVNIYDVEHASLIGSLSGHSAWVLSVAAHPTAKQIATGYEFSTRILPDHRPLIVLKIERQEGQDLGCDTAHLYHHAKRAH